MAIEATTSTSTQLMFSDDVPVTEAICRVLEEAGIEYVFGLPGGNTVRIYNALHDHRDTIRAVICREEGIGAIMAEVYGRLTGRPGVVMGQGAFVLQGSLGAMEAHLGSSPMLMLTEITDNAPFTHHAPTQSGSGEYGAWDAKASFGGFSKRVMQPLNGPAAVQSTQLAIKHATTGDPGPVTVLYYGKALGETVGPTSVPRIYPTQAYLPTPPPPADPATIERAAEILTNAQRPVIIAGNGVRVARAFEELEAVASALGAPVATTAEGKGTFIETHDLALGVMGNFGTPGANATVAEADVLLVVGSRLSPSDTANAHPDLINPLRQTIIQIDIEPLHASWTFPVDTVIIGDARQALGALSDAIAAAGGVPQSTLDVRREAVLSGRKQHGYFDAPELYSDVSPILPQRVIKSLATVIGEDSFVTADAGENRIFMTHFYQTKSRHGFLQGNAVAGMGYAIPAALAAKLVYPERQVVAVCSDGGYGMSMNAMLTAYEEQIPVVAVILNNNALGWVKHGMGPRAVASDFADFDFAAIARSFGCGGIRVDHPTRLDAALAEALDSGVPFVVDVRTSLDEDFNRVTAPLAKATY